MDPQSQPNSGIYLSVVAPAHNEADNLPRLLEEAAAALATHRQKWEIIINDDGSAGLLFCAIVRADPVFILGQSFGSIVYVRNLMLIHRGHRATVNGPAAPPA